MTERSSEAIAAALDYWRGKDRETRRSEVEGEAAAEIRRLSARCAELEAILTATASNYNSILVDNSRWQQRAEAAEARCAALEQEKQATIDMWNKWAGATPSEEPQR